MQRPAARSSAGARTARRRNREHGLVAGSPQGVTLGLNVLTEVSGLSGLERLAVSPPFILADAYPEKDYQEWLDSYWARDVQNLFRLEKRAAFLKFIELVFAQSGGIFEASKFAAPCEVGRATIANYLSVLEATGVACLVRPFSTHLANEIVAAPKVYGFDTGFVCFFRGWDTLREDDKGILWEHLALNEMLSVLQSPDINYWRDKAGHELDFVLQKRGRPPLAIECKWKALKFDPAALRSFRRRYPQGDNLVISSDIDRPHEKNIGASRSSSQASMI